MFRYIAPVLLLTAACLISPLALPPAGAAEDPFDRFIAETEETFDNPTAVVDAFKARLAADDKEGVLKLLGLDPAAVAASEGLAERFNEIRDMAAVLLTVQEPAPDRRILLIGREVWPFPFPIVLDDGKWSFDTAAGLDEIINRRIGENELNAIATARAYVIAQEAYKASDWDGDGVSEYAQKLISTSGTYDGLYWPSGDGVPDSPAGAYVEQAEAEQGKKVGGDGYFGYHFRILKGQGDNIAGGKYDYVINGNMIAGFGLIAWPAKYDNTGVNTFVVNQYGTVYQKDLGPDTEALVEKIRRFNPDDSWSVVTEVTQ